MIFADREPQALWEESVGDSHGLGVLESHRDSSLLSLLFFFFNLFGKILSHGIILHKPVRLPALDRDSAFCYCPVCLFFCLLKAFCNKDMEMGGFL